MSYETIHRRTSGTVTFSGTSATAYIEDVMTGVMLGAKVTHSGSGFTIDIQDQNGYSVIGGSRAVGASGLELYTGDVGGNPVWPDVDNDRRLTITATAGTDSETFSVDVYVKG